MENYKNRRKQLGQRYSRTLFIISSGTQMMRSHSVGYRYKRASDFYYLTGLDDSADSVLLILGEQRFLLRAQANAEKQMWGDEIPLTREQTFSLADVRIEDLSRLEELLNTLALESDRVALALGRDSGLEQILLRLLSFENKNLRRRSAQSLHLCDSRLLVGALRLHKEKDEISLLREAALRSSDVHRELMATELIGKTERDIANKIEAAFLHRGMQWAAYETIVGSGERGKLLHARASDRVIQHGELILIDAGGEYKGYCADITRVICASTTFSSQQREFYQLVLQAQKKVLANVKPGATLSSLHTLAEELIQNGLQEMGRQILRMPHKTSHWLGLDVHDPAPYVDDRGEELKLGEGMVFTVEPGLYLGEVNFGIRIEDDVVVTKAGCEILSNAPKELEEIESLRPWSS